MSLMKAVAIAVTLLLAGGTASGQQHLQKPALRMAVEGAYAPFNALGADGRLHGFDIDFGEELCKRLHRDCQWSVVQWDGLIPALQSGKVDIVMSSMTITAERRTQVRFSKPYYFSYGLMIAPKGSDLHFTPQSLENRAIGVQASTTHEHWLHERFGPKVDIHAYPSSDEMFLDFSNGRLDAIFAESVALFPWMEQNGGQKAFAQIGPDITDPALGTQMGVAVAQDNEALGQAINDAIDEIINDGTFDKIERIYFKTLNLRP